MTKTILLIGITAALGVFLWFSSNSSRVMNRSNTISRSPITRPEQQSVVQTKYSNRLEIAKKTSQIGCQGNSPKETKSSVVEVFHTSSGRLLVPTEIPESPQHSPRRDNEAIDFKQLSDRQIVSEQVVSPEFLSIGDNKSKSVIPKASALVKPHAPAAWVQVPDSSFLTASQQEEIQPLAEALLDRIQSAEQQSPTPESQIAIRNTAVLASDAEFRRKYGQRAWMEHHIQAYHLGLSK